MHCPLSLHISTQLDIRKRGRKRGREGRGGRKKKTKEKKRGKEWKRKKQTKGKKDPKILTTKASNGALRAVKNEKLERG